MKLQPFTSHFENTMRLKIWAGTRLVDDNARADVFLPVWMLVTGVLFVGLGAVFCAVLIALSILPVAFLLPAVLVLVGIVFILYWKNQTIRILTNDSFEYRTLWGKGVVYRFGEIKGIKKSMGSIIMLVRDGKVYIDSGAILSGRLIELIDKRLEELNKEN